MIAGIESGCLAFLPCISFQPAAGVSIQITAAAWKSTNRMNTWLKWSFVLVQAEHNCKLY